MKQFIESATLEYYNANNRGTNAPDCVKRGMSLAYDISYSEMSKLLNNKMKEYRCTAWNEWPVFTSLIKDLGYSNHVGVDGSVTLDQFVDEQADPNKIYLILVGKDPRHSSHMVCVRDNKIWDSWDSRKYYVIEYWVINRNEKTRAVTDIKDHLNELAENYIYPVCLAELKKQMNKHNLDGTLETKMKKVGYAVQSRWCLTLAKTDQLPKRRVYNIEITFPFEPTMTMDDAIAFVNKIGKIRMYDRMYAIVKQENDLEQEYEMRIQTGQGQTRYDRFFRTNIERRFYDSLPGWVKGLMISLHIQDPGEYMDSYSLKIRKLPSDDIHPDHSEFWLESYTADQMKEQLERYGKTHEIEGIDYYEDY